MDVYDEDDDMWEITMAGREDIWGAKQPTSTHIHSSVVYSFIIEFYVFYIKFERLLATIIASVKLNYIHILGPIMAQPQQTIGCGKKAEETNQNLTILLMVSR